MKEKIAKLLKRVFAVCEFLLMAASLIVAVAYIAAFIVGGETAAMIDNIIYNCIFPAMFFLVVIFAFIGIIYLYLTGYMTFRFDTKKKK